MDKYGSLPGRYPAIVKTYDQVTRTCRVEIPGITDGGNVLPNAEIEYAIGDRSRLVEGQHATEIEILPGDLIWVAFIGGDQRYPLITGFRNPQSGNDVDWRRYHHKNMELIADAILHIVVGNSSITMVPESLTLAVGSSNIVITGDGIHINGTRIDLN